MSGSDRDSSEAEDTEGREPDPGAEKLVYEIDGWAADAQSAFCDLLERLGIPYEHDAAMGLEVRTADEDAVESALDDFLGEAERKRRERRTTSGEGHPRVELSGTPPPGSTWGEAIFGEADLLDVGSQKPMTEGRRGGLNAVWWGFGRQILRRLFGG